LNFVLDASVALAWCFEDEVHEPAMSVLDSLRHDEAVAPHHWTLEVANGLLSAERRGRIDGDGATRFTRLLLALPIAVDPVSRATAFTETRRLARRHELTSFPTLSRCSPPLRSRVRPMHGPPRAPTR
jgi:predicted nucleic acid-binding protein